MVTIIFETHATTLDNEAGLAAGWFDVALSKKGEEQAKELGRRRSGEDFAVVFCSDLQRSYKTAEIAFGNKFPIIQDPRLRECDYGDLTRTPKSQITNMREECLTTAYPNGESFTDTSHRIKSFLTDIAEDFAGETVLIIGHRATQYGLEEWCNGHSLAEAVLSPWHWQPGWKYTIV